MKYWRGYLVAAILAACTWAFQEFAQSHSKLVDMVYPYITRMIQTFMAGWSGGVEFCDNVYADVVVLHGGDVGH